MTYPGSNRSNWDSDRQKRIKLYDQLKRYQKPLSRKENKKSQPEASIEESKKYDWILPVLGAVLKIGLFLVIFYAFAMILAHGKYWPK